MFLLETDLVPLPPPNQRILPSQSTIPQKERTLKRCDTGQFFLLLVSQFCQGTSCTNCCLVWRTLKWNYFVAASPFAQSRSRCYLVQNCNNIIARDVYFKAYLIHFITFRVTCVLTARQSCKTSCRCWTVPETLANLIFLATCLAILLKHKLHEPLPSR